MLVRQSKNSFIRVIDNQGYITNQLTCWDRTNNETGTDFLSTITREEKDVDEIIDRIHCKQSVAQTSLGNRYVHSQVFLS